MWASSGAAVCAAPVCWYRPRDNIGEWCEIGWVLLSAVKGYPQEAGSSQYEFAASQDIHASQSLFTGSFFGLQQSQQVRRNGVPTPAAPCNMKVDFLPLC